MGIRFYCPNGHKLNVKSFQAGRRGICPFCGASMMIPTESTIPTGKQAPGLGQGQDAQPAMPATDQPLGLSSHPSAAQPMMPPTQSPVQPATIGTPTAGTWSAAPMHLGTPELSTPAEPLAAAPTAPANTMASPMAGASSDPLTEAPTAVWYVRPAAGGQYGPATAEIMRCWLSEGRVGADSLVWREGWRDWQEAGQVFPQLKPDAMTTFLSGKAGPSRPNASLPSAASRPRTSTAMIIGVLALAVVALLIVFLLILFQQSPVEPEPKAGTPAEKAAIVAPRMPHDTLWI